MKQINIKDAIKLFDKFLLNKLFYLRQTRNKFGDTVTVRNNISNTREILNNFHLIFGKIYKVEDNSLCHCGNVTDNRNLCFQCEGNKEEISLWK